MFVLALLALGLLNVYPWLPSPERVTVLWLIPLPLLLWVIWTGLVVALVTCVAFVWDPYRRIAESAHRGVTEGTTDDG